MDKDEVDWLYLLFGGKEEWEGGSHICYLGSMMFLERIRYFSHFMLFHITPFTSLSCTVVRMLLLGQCATITSIPAVSSHASVTRLAFLHVHLRTV